MTPVYHCAPSPAWYRPAKPSFACSAPQQSNAFTGHPATQGQRQHPGGGQHLCGGQEGYQQSYGDVDPLHPTMHSSAVRSDTLDIGLKLMRPCTPPVAHSPRPCPSRLLNTVLSRYSSTSYAVSNPTLATQEDEITLPDGEPAVSLALREFLHIEWEDPLHSP